MRRRVGERFDDLQLFDDRTRPAVRDDERQRVVVLGANVDEVNVQPVDLGNELRQRVQLRLALTPVVAISPVVRELLRRLEGYTLRLISNRLLIRPPRGRNPRPQIFKIRLRSLDRKRLDLFGLGRHLSLLEWWGQPPRVG